MFALVVTGDEVLICSSVFESVLPWTEYGNILIWRWLCLCKTHLLNNKTATKIFSFLLGAYEGGSIVT